MFRAYEPARDRLVAVKLFRLDLPPERVHQLVAELEKLIGAELTHPSVAAPLATGIAGTLAYLAQDFVTADSLDIVVRDFRPTPAADVVRAATQLAGALDFAADVNIVHGALHPRDVLLSPDETHLTGLGVTGALERVGIATPVRRPYTAPERVAGAAWGRRADIFSLAVLAHEMLWARRVTATGEQAAGALTELGGGDLAALRRVFARALAEEAGDRFDTALEFAEALRDAFPGATLASREPPVASRQSTRRPRRSTDARRLLAEVEPLLPLDDEGVVSSSSHGREHGGREDENSSPEIDDFDVAKVFTLADPHAAGDLDLRAAESARYQDVESAPSVVELAIETSRVGLEETVHVGPRSIDPEVAPTRPPAALMEPYAVEPADTALDRARSAVWPLAAALIVGLAVGFAGGYGVGSHERPTPAGIATEIRLPSTAAVSPTRPRESTEGAVNEPAKAQPAGRGVDLEAGAVAQTDPAPTPLAPIRAAAAPPRAIAGGSGRISVRSTPAGARVFLDGRDVGRTPITTGDLTRGTYRVRVAREGYVTEQRRVVITASRPAQSVTVNLARARADTPFGATPSTIGRDSGGLIVESRPEGASVFVDGELVGKTPLSLDAVAAGEHAVRLERDGYRQWSSSSRVVAGERNRVTASLEK